MNKINKLNIYTRIHIISCIPENLDLTLSFVLGNFKSSLSICSVSWLILNSPLVKLIKNFPPCHYPVCFLI